MIDMMKIVVTTTGGNGVATGDTTHGHPRSGKVLAVYLDYHASAPATTDVTLAAANTPTENILTISNNKTDGWYYPRKETVLNDGSSTYARYVAEHVFHDNLKLSVAQANALTDCVTAYIYFEP